MSSTASSFLALSCVGFIASAPAAADPLDGAAAPAATAPDGGEQRGDDIVVNGERIRRESDPKAVAPLVDTPRSVVVLPREVIEQTGSVSLADALRTVPGITFGAAEGGNPIGDRPFIRGFDSQGSTYLDGVRDIGAQSREIFAVEQVQVVRGSDSTLGGRGSAGGSINIVSKMPQPGDFASATGSYGNADFKRVTGDLNLSLGQNAGFRIQGLWHDQDVAGRDELFQKRWGVAPSFTLGLTGDTRLTVMYYHLETDELPDSGFPYAYVLSGSVDATPAGSSGRVIANPAVGNFTTASGRTGRISPDNFYGLVDRDFRRTNIDQATVRAEHDFGGVRLRNTARYSSTKQAYIFTQPDDSQGNVFGIPAGNRNVGTLPGVPAQNIPANQFNNYTAGGRVWRRANTRVGRTDSLIDQLDLSGKLSTGTVEHSFAIGGELAWEKAIRNTYAVNTGVNNGVAGLRCGTAPGTPPYNCTDLFNPNPNDPWVNYVAGAASVPTPITRGASSSDTQNDARTHAVYAFDSITLLPQLILNLGARYEGFDSRVRLPLLNGTRPEVRRNDDYFTWQAGVVAKPTPNTSIYASYATAAIPPNSLIGEGSEGNALGTTSATVTQAQAQAASDALKVERTRNYEVGAKADLFDARLSLTAAVFQTESKNARVTSDANTVAFIGARRVRGVEFNFNGRVTPEWTVFGGYTYLDAKIVDGGFTTFTLPAGGGVAARTVSQPSVNTGQRFPQTPAHSGTLWTNYDFGPVEIGGGAIYMGRVNGGYADNRYVSGTGATAQVVPATVLLVRSVPSYWRFDARAAVNVTPKISLSVNAQNLTDKRYFSQAFASHYATIAPGRTVFGTLSVRY
jgi:catecholate siderophore receptor